jgi:FkbM family methyltransferase
MNHPDSYGILTKVKKFFFPTTYDKEQKQLLKERVAFYSGFISSRDLCFDIGANYGNRTEIFLRNGAKVIALEPQESCYSYLQKKYGRKAVVIKKGAGSKNEILDFYINEKSSQVSTFSKAWINEFKHTRFAGSEWNKVEKVDVVTLDSLITDYGHPQFIKIDVEGFEYEVLKGLTKPFKYLSFEYAVPERSEALNSCLAYLAGTYKGVFANFAKGENTFLELKNWLPINEMIKFVKEEEFISSYAGDIYIESEKS